MMLNQCIFIGKISSVITDNQGETKLVIEVKSNSNAIDKISIDLPLEMSLNDFYKEGSILAIKARVTSSDEKTYSFLAERITILGGITRES